MWLWTPSGSGGDLGRVAARVHHRRWGVRASYIVSPAGSVTVIPAYPDDPEAGELVADFDRILVEHLGGEHG
ncbi:MAG: hypothetical protein ACOZNI_30110 [Myxococcota bacterium]